MDQLSEEVRQESPWTMMFADDIVICSESREKVEENLERWRFALERRGMKVSRSKTEYMCVNEREGSGRVRLQGEEVKKVQEFKYLGSTVQSNGECGKEVKERVQAGWNGWRKVSGVLCDQKISARIKGKVYRTVVRPAMLYGLETVSLRKRQESELEVAELKMLSGTMPAATVDHSQKICEVWASNLDDELKRIRQVIRKYNYIAMDTEFPGVVARPIGEFRSNADYQYQLLRCNVDLLKIIQLGLTFMNEQGEYPPGTSTWQFNFRFNLTEDMYAQDSIELLTTSGIQFKKHEEEGIETLYFAELLMTSGVVLCEGVKWLSFHSGYDFGYLIKILSNSKLPEEEVDFFEILRLFFPIIYDVKYLMKSCKNLKACTLFGGLQEVAEQLELERIGPQHQAGSDSLLTGMAFFKMRESNNHPSLC
ncbi:hypothetical protein QTP70_021210 [Hemibagrus guttatus]|uniref:Reverse transcriptase domain-containing protein n=1 Tax=Hemibagrus guttatus TaxID=175788 RepID=A0AAE0QXL1_9TELE|nr:hypothetical protein QTP70_021210 [Hemibagrus guttatus]